MWPITDVSFSVNKYDEDVISMKYRWLRLQHFDWFLVMCFDEPSSWLLSSPTFRHFSRRHWFSRWCVRWLIWWCARLIDEISADVPIDFVFFWCEGPMMWNWLFFSRWFLMWDDSRRWKMCRRFRLISMYRLLHFDFSMWCESIFSDAEM